MVFIPFRSEIRRIGNTTEYTNFLRALTHSMEDSFGPLKVIRLNIKTTGILSFNRPVANEKLNIAKDGCVTVGLLDVKPGFVSQVRPHLRRFPLSTFLAKTLRENKPAMKKFLKKIGRSELTLNCRLRHSCINLTHTT